jgi:hypothetical protein
MAFSRTGQGVMIRLETKNPSFKGNVLSKFNIIKEILKSRNGFLFESAYKIMCH